MPFPFILFPLDHQTQSAVCTRNAIALWRKWVALNRAAEACIPHLYRVFTVRGGCGPEASSTRLGAFAPSLLATGGIVIGSARECKNASARRRSDVFRAQAAAGLCGLTIRTVVDRRCDPKNRVARRPRQLPEAPAPVREVGSHRRRLSGRVCHCGSRARSGGIPLEFDQCGSVPCCQIIR